MNIKKFQSYYRKGPETCSKTRKKYIIWLPKINLKNPKAIIGTGPKRVQKPINNSEF